MPGKESDLVSSLQSENTNLKKAVHELSILNEIASAIDSTDSVNSIINLIVKKCIKHIQVEQCVVWLLDNNDIESQFHTMIRRSDDSQFNYAFELDAQLTGWMINNKKPLIVNDLKNDNRFQITDKDKLDFNSVLCTPLLVKGNLIGLISAFNKKNNATFDEYDQRLLTIIASQSASVLENSRLYEEEQKLISFKEEMRLAREIQLNILPQEIPAIKNFEIAATGIPAKEVGGDYYDFIKLSENKLAFCLGDITGKGIPAAMLVSNLQATLRGQLQSVNETGTCLTSSNKLLFNSTEYDKFATLFLGILDKSKNQITFSNAGHDRPILIRNSDCIILNNGGLLLGALPDSEYEDYKIELMKDDILVIYSDGITEAMNEYNEQFTLERLKSLLIKNSELNTKELISKIINEVKMHSANSVQSDDITILIIKKTS